MSRMRHVVRISAGVAACLAASTALPSLAQPVAQKAPAESASTEAQHDWQNLYELDLAYLEALIPTHYIYAVRPGGSEWDQQFQASVAQAHRDAAAVRDFETYRAAVQRFIVSFQDAHFSAHFLLNSRRARWPKFLVTYRGGDYVVTQSRTPDVKVGSQVSSCDGESVDSWIDRLTTFFGGPKGLETTRASIASEMFVDRGNPFYAVPKSCRIGNADVTLAWTDTGEDVSAVPPEAERTSVSAPTLEDPHERIEDFGSNGAWVRIGTMMPANPAQADEFNQLIARAPALRSKDVIVIDVRGNPGGTYAWFMAFLRGLYGSDYADYYARARLEISNVLLVVSPTGVDDPGFSAEQRAVKDPPDPPMDVLRKLQPKVQMLPNGERVITMAAPISVLPARPSAPPPNPVKAKVYLLTDFGCASACLSFTDEMMRFPGVVQIGAETHIDRRSAGWPESFKFPSGLGFVRMGRLVREGRARGENVAWKPAMRFPGDIADTPAVKRWVLETVIPAKGAGSK